MQNNNNKKINEEEVRNVLFPLAVARPSIFKKIIIVGSVVLYIMMVISFFTSGFLTNYAFIELGIILLLLYGVSTLYDYFYRCNFEDRIDEHMLGVVVGFSNKVFILADDRVVDECETDEVRIRKVSEEELDNFFYDYTSVLECYKEGKLITRVCIDKVEELEGIVLSPDMSRADEDIKIIYDDDEDFDDDDGDLVEDLEDLEDLDDED